MPKQTLSDLHLRFTLMLVLLGLVLPVHAMTDVATAQSLRNKLDRRSEVGVIVTFESMGNVAAAKTAFAKQAHRSRLKSAQQSLLDQLPGVNKNRVRSYRYVPQMATRVNRQSLEKLLAMPNIRVAYDKFYKLLLDESVPHVFPDQQTSPYDGGNEWAVAVLDSGVDKSHPFLANKVIAEACFSNEVGLSPPFISQSACPNNQTSQIGDDTGIPCSVSGCDHGTRVAGVVAGSDGAFNGHPINGVAKSGKIISIQVMTILNEHPDGDPNDADFCWPFDYCAVAYESDLIAALEHVLDLKLIHGHKIAAVNMSLGAGFFPQPDHCDDNSGEIGWDMALPINALKNAGVATVVASGNDGETSLLSVPACVKNAIAVGSIVNTTDTVSAFSNSSIALDLYAPGEPINSSVPGIGYSDNPSGTSLAAPHVAGAWAVIKHAKPSATVDEVEALLKAHGPIVGKSPTDPNSRRRLELTEALNTLCGGGACATAGGDLCFPIKAANGKAALICL